MKLYLHSKTKLDAFNSFQFRKLASKTCYNNRSFVFNKKVSFILFTSMLFLLLDCCLIRGGLVDREYQSKVSYLWFQRKYS